MLRENGLIGAIVIYRNEVLPFYDKKVELVENFAAQAVIAMENARLITETRDALEQQTATAEILRVVSGSQSDVQPVFEAIVESASNLCEEELSAVAQYDGAQLDLVALNNMSPDEAAAFQSLFPRSATPSFIMGRAFIEGRPVNVEDILADPAYDLRTREVLAGPYQYRSFLAVPILREGAPIGVIGGGRREVRPFTAKQIELVRTFADQAVIAIENARLINEAREALEQQTATAEVLGVINSSPGDLTPVFDAMLEKAIRLCDAEHGILWTLEGERARLACSRSDSPEFVELLRQQGEAGTHPLLQRVIGGEHLFQLNLPEHEVYRTGGALERISAEAGARTVIWVALVKDGVAVGAFVIGRAGLRRFTDREIALIENFAAQAVIAMENARLITETREALEQQTATAEVLSVINSSPGDLTPVFAAILDKAHRLCGATRGTLFLYDGEKFCAAATHGYPEELVEQLRRGFSDSETSVARLLAGVRWCTIRICGRSTIPMPALSPSAAVSAPI